MADELLVHQDALQVRMAPETDPEHVPDFPLVPIRTCPQRSQGIDFRLSLPDFSQRHLQSQPVFERQGKEVVDDDKARRWRAGPGILIWNLGRWAHRDSRR